MKTSMTTEMIKAWCDLQKSHAELKAQRDALLKCLTLAVKLIETDVIRVRDSERRQLLDALEQWNTAIGLAAIEAEEKGGE